MNALHQNDLHQNALQVVEQATPVEIAHQRNGAVLPLPFMDLSVAVIRDMPVQNVTELKRFEALVKSELSNLSVMIQAALAQRYGELAAAKLLSEGKDTGTIHLMDDGYDIAVEVGKDTSWDQQALKDIWGRIADSGQDPSEYINVRYSVSEAKFKSWPASLREPFEAARTVEPKAPKFKFSRVDGEAQ